MISEQVTVTSQSHNKFFCSWYLFLLFLISCGLPSIWPHVISRNNVHPILLPPLLIGLAKIQWSYCSSIYRCKLQVEPLLSQLWCQELSACLSSSYCLLSYLKNLFWVQVIGCFYRCLKSNMMLLIKNCCLL